MGTTEWIIVVCVASILLCIVGLIGGYFIRVKQHDKSLQMAREKVEGIIAEGKAKAEKTAEAEKTKILENGKKQSDMRYQQIISEAKMNARRAELGAKEEVIEAAFDKATDELKNIASSGSDEYDDSLSKMIKEAVDELGGNDLIIQ